MGHGKRGLFKGVVLLEAGAAIIFFGSLMHRPELAEHGASALRDLAGRGYEVPTSADPVRVYPASTGAPLDPAHAAGWRPGVISLRENPIGSVGAEVYLRHDLMHEASFRTCRGTLPLWAEEAAAMSFSGELLPQPRTEQSGPDEFEHLRQRVRPGARLDAESYRALAKLVASYGWPKGPCAVSEEIEKLLAAPSASGETHFSYILISLVSGQVLESRGDIQAKHPPGSLLKIPYAAALDNGSGEAIGEELAASDTTKLLSRRNRFDLGKYRLLISPVENTVLGQSIPLEEIAGKGETFWRRYLGERGQDGAFPLEASLQELALVLRASLLSRPAHFRGLSRNGFMEGSTLYSEPEADKRILRKLHAVSKTGTAADQRGSPLVGHLMVAWPAEEPTFLSVFRSMGMNGASNIRRASRILEEWASRYPMEFGRVRVRLLTLAPRSSWEILDECPSFEGDGNGGWRERVSTCGRFRIISSARGSRSERFVFGVLDLSPDGQKVVLETDPETYADAVLTAEAQDLQGEARKALRAVIVWNGARGKRPHEETYSLCDTTHCMVFLGNASQRTRKRSGFTDPTLLRLLDELALRNRLDWLPFSKGGVEKWERQVDTAELNKLVDEPSVLDVRRERTRSGDVVVHLVYPENEETVPCEVFRNRLKLLSCPEVIRLDVSRGAWIFGGIGEGHGQGLSVERARALAQSGSSAAEILTDAYK